MSNLERRIERMESQVETKPTGKGELYNWEGYPVDGARVIRWPAPTGNGEAILPDGTHREIAAASRMTLEDLIRHDRRDKDPREDRPRLTAQEKQARREAYRDILFMRIDGRVSIEELLYSQSRGRDPEPSSEGDTPCNV
jgi:hypothetical protein